MKRLLASCILLAIGFSASPQNSCPPNIGFSLGDFTNWQCYTGTVAAIGCSSRQVTVTPSSPITGRHTIIPPTQLLDPFGGFNITPLGNNVARLGAMGQIGAQVERLSYTFTIPSSATQYSLSFMIAGVFQDPSHCSAQNPFFSAKVFNVSTGLYIDCLSAETTATIGANGFQVSPNTSQGTVLYTTWTPVTLILSDYAGQTLRLEFTNGDCTASGHWAYAYLDFPETCGQWSAGNQFCPGSAATLVAPHGYQSYAWWNSNFSQNLGSSQTLTLSSPPANPTVYAVDLIPITGVACRDTAYITVQSYPAVQANAGPDTMICSGSSGITIGSPSLPGYSYSWTPSVGLNNPSIAQPTATMSSTYVLTVTDSLSGCSKKDTVTVYVNSLPAAFSVNNHTQCITGNLFQFTMNSNPTATNYHWSFGDGTTSILQNPPHTYAAPGVYNVKVKLTNTSGCQDSSSKIVTVLAAVPAATITLSGNVLTSSATTGNQWYLNGVAINGANGQTYTATAPGIYTVVVTLNGCISPSSNSITYTVTGINPVVSEWKLQLVPNPVADKLVISFNAAERLNLEILDLAGRRLFRQIAIPSIYTLDLSKFLKGTYLVILTNSKTKQAVRQMIVKI